VARAPDGRFVASGECGSVLDCMEEICEIFLAPLEESTEDDWCFRRAARSVLHGLAASGGERVEVILES
jgi:hypothetical protein